MKRPNFNTSYFLHIFQFIYFNVHTLNIVLESFWLFLQFYINISQLSFMLKLKQIKTECVSGQTTDMV